MMKEFCLLVILFTWHLDSYTAELTTVNTEPKPIKKEKTSDVEKTTGGVSGEYVLEREDKDYYVKHFPHKKEYERIVVQQTGGAYEIFYYGVKFEGDHDYLGFFIVKAEDVKVDKNKISFTLPDRDFFPPEHAPQNLEEVKDLSKKFWVGGSSDKIFMKGTLIEHKITFRCEGNDCLTDVMVFVKKQK